MKNYYMNIYPCKQNTEWAQTGTHRSLHCTAIQSQSQQAVLVSSSLLTDSFLPINTTLKMTTISVDCGTVDDFPGNSCHCPSPLCSQKSRLPCLSLKGNHKVWFFIVRLPASNSRNQTPWATAKQMEVPLLPGWFLLLLWHNSVSFHIIIFDSCHKPKITAIWYQHKSHSLSWTMPESINKTLSVSHSIHR